MILEPPDNADESLTGHIQTFPLIIEDQQTEREIKVSKVYVNSCHTEDKGPIKSEYDILFPNISIVAICQEGLFKGLLSKHSYLGIRHPQTKSAYTDEQWKDVVLQLFPIEESDLTDQKDVSVKITAKYTSLFNNYDEELVYLDDAEGYCDDFITLEFQTKAKLPVTLGTFQLQRVDDEENDDEQPQDGASHEEEGSYSDYVNVFKWMDLLVSQNKQLLDKLMELSQEKNQIEIEKEDILNNYNTAKQEFEEINTNLKNKFYSVLKSKKDKIWALQNALGQTSDKIPQLNEKYLQGSGLVSTKFDKIRKVPTDTTPLLKRQKVAVKQEPVDAPILKPRLIADPIVVKHEPLVLDADITAVKKEPSFYGRNSGDSELVKSILGDKNKQETDEDNDDNDDNGDNDTAYEDSSAGEEEEEEEEDENEEGDTTSRGQLEVQQKVQEEGATENSPEKVTEEEDAIEDSLREEGNRNHESHDNIVEQIEELSDTGTVYSDEEDQTKPDIVVKVEPESIHDIEDEGTDYSSEEGV